jgi:glycosyltransferase involved in cell wall biosynthesis
MSKPPKVSVVIPLYNRERYIERTIESVLSQTYSNVELIVVDDGCTDQSLDLVEQYASRLVCLEHPGRINRGQSAAINLGLRKCTGKYVAILDSDDLFAPTKIERQVAYLETRPNVGLVYSNGTAIDEHDRPLYPIFNPGHHPPKGPEEILKDCFIGCPSSTLVRKTLFETVGPFDESLRAAQDHDMLIRLLEHAPVGYIQDFLWSYRIHGESISATKAMIRWRNGFYILRKARCRYPYPIGVVLKRLAVLHFRMGQCYLAEKKYVHSGIHFMKAGLFDPFRALRVATGFEKIN